MSELIGRRLGQYEITARLGEGGMATVYRAHQASVRRDVAIKIIESKLARNPEFVLRFEREAMTLASLDHPHILKIHDFGREEDLLYLVMELKSGGSLAERIREGPLELIRAAKLLDQIAPALDHAHSKGIVHRDLKPQNVLLDEGGNVFLTDFGIAKLLSAESTALTAGGMAMGTPGYMAPEQWYGQQIDARTDLYALGVMVFEMLTGQVPFSGDTPATLMYQHLNEAPLSLLKLRPDLPDTLESVLLKAMAKQPEQRYQNAEVFATAFRVGITGGPSVYAATIKPAPPHVINPTGDVTDIVVLPKESSLHPQGGRWLIALGLLALILVVIAAAVMLRGNGDTPAGILLLSPTDPIVALNPTTTEAPIETVFSPTHTAVPTATETFTPTATHTTTATITPSFTSIPQTATQTPNQETLIAEILATETQQVADMIASYTKTPTLTPSQTPDLPSTARAAANQTLTAIVVLSFTHTPTVTLTPTVTNTLTYTATLTPTPTSTSTLTFTPTASHTPSPVPTAPPTATPFASGEETGTHTLKVDGVILEVTDAGTRLIARATPSRSARQIDLLFVGDRILWKGKRIDGYLEIYLSDGSKAYVTDDPSYVSEVTLDEMTPDLRVGALIRITVDGDGMHMRTNPSVHAREVSTLRTNQTIEVVGGPKEAEYYLWWQLRLPDGRTGWAVNVPQWWQVIN